ncbi:MAG TPA: polyamine aminopropyltransferase [Rhabdochlamydiaceae bacterium]|nr:polyamine aminopropyltransferase [Rhabdochlamydiaceae bacterium]
MKKILLTIFAASLPFTSVIAESWFTETLFDNWRQTMKVDKVLYQKKTDYQDLMIFENELLGRVLSLDGAVQLTEADEYVYHEMLTHVPVLAHGNVKDVLIVGGGDGGMLREMVRHKEIKRITLVEIDRSVIELAKEYLPSLSKGAYNDPRVEIIIKDGAEFVKTTDRKYDVVICDSTDPIGPGEALFTAEFFANCKRVLKEKGIFVCQNGVPFMQKDELIGSFQKRAALFKDASFYVATVPTYVGGFMAFGWSTDEPSYREITLAELKSRFQKLGIDTRYYTPEIHKASFALPRFIEQQLSSN